MTMFGEQLAGFWFIFHRRNDSDRKGV